MLARWRHTRLSSRLAYFISLRAFQKHPLTTMRRVLTWRILCALGLPSTVRISAWDNARMKLLPKWQGAGVTLFYVARELYEPELTYLHRFLKPGDVFVDAGANCGVFTIAAANQVGSKGRVLAFEPGDESFAMLKSNVELNSLQQVALFHEALSNSDGEAQLFSHHHGASSFSLGRGPNDTAVATVRTRTLDTALAQASIEQVSCIKMDVEGAEELILRGAQEALDRCKPVVIFEINTAAIVKLGLNRDGAWRLLAERGYRFQQLTPAGESIPIASPPEDTNVVALPPNWR